MNLATAATKNAMIEELETEMRDWRKAVFTVLKVATEVEAAFTAQDIKEMDMGVLKGMQKIADLHTQLEALQ